MYWYIYILLCDNVSYYTGLTNNLARRLRSHKNKYNLATKEFTTIQLVYKEKFLKRTSAEIREKQIKGWSRAKKKALVTGNLDLLKKISKTRSA